jgi:chemotaxis protein MotB
LNRAVLLMFVLPVLLLSGGCVSMGVFEQKAADANGLSRELLALQKKHEELKAENSSLRNRLEKLNDDFTRVSGERDKVEADRKELDRILKSKSDSASKALGEQREKTFALERESASLQERLAKQDKAREEDVKSISNHYENLVHAMKDEIAQGRVTILERKGKLTVDVTEEVLFAPGGVEIKPEGVAFLQQVFPILKNTADRVIHVEGHTDSTGIDGAPAKQYATHWEFSAARAVNVTRHLEKMGIDAALLSALACGESRPVAENGASAGRSKNRRIAIIVQPKN